MDRWMRTKEDFVSISMDDQGQVQIGKTLITSKEELDQQLDDLYATNHDQKILISGDRETRNGDMMQLLAKIRLAGFQKVAFAIKSEPNSAGGPEVPVMPGAAPNARSWWMPRRSLADMHASSYRVVS